MKNVFIIGSKGIPAAYGGFETFVEKLTEKKLGQVYYHVACQATKKAEFIHNDSRCFQIATPYFLGSACAIYYDIAS